MANKAASAAKAKPSAARTTPRSAATPAPTPAAPLAWASGITVPVGDLGQVARIAADRGQPAAVAGIDLPGTSWAEVAPTSPAITGARKLTADASLRVPLTMGGTTVADVAAGRVDAQWQTLGRTLSTMPRRPVVRLAVPAGTDPAQARAAWRRAATAVRQTAGTKAVIEWAAPVGTTPETAAASYPGDELVDVIGLTVDPRKPWASQVTGTGSLTAWTTWAAQHSRRVAVHWTLDGTTPAEVSQLQGWLNLSATKKRVAYETTSAVGKGGKDAVRTYLSLW